jgi:hypothetical protein
VGQPGGAVWGRHHQARAAAQCKQLRQDWHARSGSGAAARAVDSGWSLLGWG